MNRHDIGKMIGDCYRVLQQFQAYKIPEKLYSRWGCYWQAFVIVACYFCYWIFSPIAPGEAIAVLGAVAIILTVRADLFTKFERMIWVVIGFALLCWELTVIKQNEAEQTREKQEQARQFRDTLLAFQDLHQQNVNQLNSMQGILSETKKAGAVAKDTLANITGGNSYLEFAIGDVMGPLPVTIQGFSNQQTVIAVNVFAVVHGTHPLHNVSVLWNTPLEMQTHEYGTLLPNSRTFSGILIRFRATETKVIVPIFSTASNGNFVQMILFLKTGDKWTWSTHLYRGIDKSKKLVAGWSAKNFPKDYQDTEWPKGQHR
jgi:hypothetical protein